MNSEKTTVQSRLVYGCIGLGGDWSLSPYGLAQIDEAEAAIETALEIGITVFDHAGMYRSGKAEAVFGEVISRAHGLRERLQIQTKCSIRLGERGLAAHYHLEQGSIIERVEASLKRLRTDYIDVLVLHRPDPLLEPAEVAAAFDELHGAGKVRHLGVSDMSAVQIQRLQACLDTPIVVNQLERLRNRAWIESGVMMNDQGSGGNGFPHGTIEYCTDNGIRLQAWGAFAQSIYSGALSVEQPSAGSTTTRLVALLAEMKNTTPEAIVLAWLMRHPASIEPVIGSRDPARIRACKDAAFQASLMTSTEWYALYEAARRTPLP